MLRSSAEVHGDQAMKQFAKDDGIEMPTIVNVKLTKDEAYALWLGVRFTVGQRVFSNKTQGLLEGVERRLKKAARS
jgi:hypothetical protein